VLLQVGNRLVPDVLGKCCESKLTCALCSLVYQIFLTGCAHSLQGHCGPFGVVCFASEVGVVRCVLVKSSRFVCSAAQAIHAAHLRVYRRQTRAVCVMCMHVAVAAHWPSGLLEEGTLCMRRVA
jgi:hypothetical protein